MLRVRSLRKYYGEFLAVRDVSLDVAPGEVVGFLGPNGAGKSTTMRIITGYLPATSGEVRVDGYEVTRHPLAVRQRIGYLPEHTPLYTDMRVREYLRYRARIKGVPRRQVEARVDEVLERAWLSDRPRQLIGTLSKGYRQRVGIADAMVGHPRLLILDEPTIGLDPAQIRAVRDLIRELAEGHTILLSTHILAEVEQVCSRVVIIARGETVADDTVEGLQARFDEHVIELTVEADEPTEKVRATLAALPGVVTVVATQAEPESPLQSFRVSFGERGDATEVAKRICRATTSAGWPLVRLSPQRPSLESIFVRLTQSAEATGSAA
ncbi:MAG: ATP-binding cassette domain-containing protein [Planctomycetota bacterium]|nr:MAG: ATP-binding cassette domain-containing protein [Planctomycetota bacterium]